MAEPTISEKLQILRAHILADTIARAVRWACFLAIVCGLVLPLAWGAVRHAGIVCGLAVLGLCLALCWHVKPQGRSARAQVREIERRYPRGD